MRMINRVAFLLALVVLIPRGARADSIVIGDTVTFSHADGGGILVTANDDPTTTFLSFCMQKNVGGPGDFDTTMYVAGISDYANYQDEDNGGDASGRDYLTSQTAWLYTQFRHNALEGFDDSENAVEALQFAIWELQGEAWIPDGESFSDLANSFVALGDEAVSNGYTGIGDVAVLNLDYTKGGADAQDQLTLVPEPSSLEFLGLGALGLFFVRRRFATTVGEFA